MSKVKRYWKKNMVYSMGMTLVGIVGLLLWYINRSNDDFKAFQGIGLAFTIMGVITAAIYWFGRNNTRIREVLVAENDEMAKKLQRSAGAISNKVTFAIVAASLIFERFITLTLWQYLLFLVISMMVTWGCAFMYHVNKNC